MRPSLLVLMTLVAALCHGGEPVAATSQVLKDEAGAAVITYYALPPAKLPSEPRLSLLIGFHGAGGDEKGLVNAPVGALERAGLREEYIVIGLKSKERGWTDADVAPVRAFIAWALKTYPIDPRRVFGMGCSSGSWFLNKVAPNNSDLFAGAITYVAGQYGVAKTDSPETHAELYWVIGQEDQTPVAATVRPQQQAFAKAGFRHVFREVRGMGHDCCRSPTIDESVRWMHALRNKRLPLAKDDAAFMAQLADPEKGARLLASPATWHRVVAIGGPQAAPAVLAGLASDKDGVRANAALACTQTMFGSAAVAALVPQLDAKGAKVRAAAITALGFQGAWNYPEAQEALCAFALDAGRSDNDRRTAVQALGQTAATDLLGSCHFKRVIWTLVDLLNDDDGPVRQLAFAALTPAGTSGFDYNPAMNKTQRAGPVGKWADWCKAQCGERPAAAVAAAVPEAAGAAK